MIRALSLRDLPITVSSGHFPTIQGLAINKFPGPTPSWRAALLQA